MTDELKCKQRRQKSVTKIAKLLVKWNDNKEKIQQLEKEQAKLDREMTDIYHKWVLRG